MDRMQLDSYLGPAADAITEEQASALLDADRMIDERWPEPDLADSREQAMSAAVQVVLGDSTLAEFGTAYVEARSAAADALAALTGAIIVTASDMSERAMAKEAGVTRMTVRKALMGKEAGL